VPSVACCVLHVACCVLHVACCALGVACCMLHVEATPRTSGCSAGRSSARSSSITPTTLSPHSRPTACACTGTPNPNVHRITWPPSRAPTHPPTHPPTIQPTRTQTCTLTLARRGASQRSAVAARRVGDDADCRDLAARRNKHCVPIRLDVWRRGAARRCVVRCMRSVAVHARCASAGSGRCGLRERRGPACARAHCAAAGATCCSTLQRSRDVSVAQQSPDRACVRAAVPLCVRAQLPRPARGGRGAAARARAGRIRLSRRPCGCV
jgi:hypothetical protein